MWITFLAMMDEDGFVPLSSVGNVASRARVSVEAAAGAIQALESPDKQDPTQEHQGRRIEKVPSGWMVLNAARYREMVRRVEVRAATRERVRKFRAGNADVTQRNAQVTQSVAVAVAVADTKGKDTVGLAPDAPPLSVKKAELRKAAASVIEFLNAKAGRNFDLNGANADHVIARLRDGETVEDCRAVIAMKCREWKGDPKMAEYLRPATLFNRTKFAQYKGALGVS